jgi:hypothetical protein
VPFLDALPTVASIAGQLLLGRKLVENWPSGWPSTSSASACLRYKALWLTVLLYAIFAVLSVVGWRAWRRLEARRCMAEAAGWCDRHRRCREHRQDLAGPQALAERAGVTTMACAAPG